MVTVRIAHAEPRPGRLDDGVFHIDHVLVVLADDAGGRALPLWLPSMDGYSIRALMDRPAGETVTVPVPEELTVRLLAAAGATVAAVDIDELGPEVTAARIEVGTAAGTRQVVGRLADGLALAAAAGAPVRVADPVMDRLAVPIRGGDLLGTILQHEPAIPKHELPRRAPRNLGFGDGLAGWHLRGPFLRDVSGSHRQDYSCAAEAPSATLRSAAPEPHGSACLGQEILAEDYRGQAVTFRAELRTEDVRDRAWLYLQVQADQPERAVHDYESAFLTGSESWVSYELTAQVPPGAIIVQFGVTLNGPGRVTLRHTDFTSGLLLDGRVFPSGSAHGPTPPPLAGNERDVN